MLLKAAGSFLGGTVIFSLFVALETVVQIRNPTLGEVLTAQGIVSWLIIIALSIMGGSIYLSIPKKDLADYKLSLSYFILAMIRSIGWGTFAAIILGAFDVKVHFIGGAVFIAGIVSELLTDIVIKMVKDIAANPWQWIQDFRSGREFRVQKREEKKLRKSNNKEDEIKYDN